MSGSEPIVEWDYEFYFSSGNTLTLTIREGRDSVTEDEHQVQITRTLEGGGRGRLTIDRAKLDYYGATVRVLEPETTTQDAGTIRVLGETPAL
jgi:hypothetical protein